MQVNQFDTFARFNGRVVVMIEYSNHTSLIRYAGCVDNPVFPVATNELSLF